MNKARWVSPVVLLMFAFLSNAKATVITIQDVPAYEWYHGCGPTAAGSIIGYYDLNGYDSLFNVSGWDDVRLTANVQDEISSPEHNYVYDPDPDLNDPAPTDTSIADFFHTSEGLDYGWSLLAFADNAFTGYAGYRGYGDWLAWNEEYLTEFTWEDLVNEILNDRPMMFLVDSKGDGESDHFIPVIGFNDETMEYGFYSTWSEDETIRWATFQGMGNAWGVGYATFIHAGAADIPEPGTLAVMFLGLAGIGYAQRRKFV